LEGETISLLKQLHDKEQDNSDRIAQQQIRYDQSRTAREERELQLLRELQQETHTGVFSEQQWSTRDGQVHAAQVLLQSGDVDSAVAQFNGVRDMLLSATKQADDIENFVRARADYFDSKQRWLQYSSQHGGKAPANPAIPTAETGIQPAIDRGEYGTLATDVLPRLTDLYAEELRLARRAPVQALAAAPRAVTDAPPPSTASLGSATVTAPSPPAASVPQSRSAPLTKREIKAERARVAVERKRAEFLEKCAKSRRPGHGCPSPGSN